MSSLHLQVLYPFGPLDTIAFSFCLDNKPYILSGLKTQQPSLTRVSMVLLRTALGMFATVKSYKAQAIHCDVAFDLYGW